MIEKTNSKIQLHPSMIFMLYRCGEQFRRRYGARFGWNDCEEIIPPDIAPVIGKTTHFTIEKNLNRKIETGELLSLEEIADMARDNVAGAWAGEILLNEKERTNPNKVKGNCIDMAVALSCLHARELAPKIEPKAVERKWVLELQGFPYDLAGTIDIEENNGTIRETKTAKRTPTQKDADTNEQLTMYALAKRICDQTEVPILYYDALVKTSIPKPVSLPTKRSLKQQELLLRRIARAAEVIERGAFMPTNSQGHVCSKMYCGYAQTCPFWSGI